MASDLGREASSRSGAGTEGQGDRRDDRGPEGANKIWR